MHRHTFSFGFTIETPLLGGAVPPNELIGAALRRLSDIAISGDGWEAFALIDTETEEQGGCGCACPECSLEGAAR